LREVKKEEEEKKMEKGKRKGGKAQASPPLCSAGL
jgi:hypothetical protein